MEAMMGFFNNLNEKIQSFMIGRNGSDRLGRWALGGAVAAMLINAFIPNVILTALSYALLFYSIYRMLSKDVSARSAENVKFEDLLERMPFGKGNRTGGKSNGAKGSSRWKSHNRPNDSKAGNASNDSASQSKIRVVCEGCGQALSVPKGRGTLKVTCPKCGHQMKVRS